MSSFSGFNSFSSFLSFSGFDAGSLSLVSSFCSSFGSSFTYSFCSYLVSSFGSSFGCSNGFSSSVFSSTFSLYYSYLSENFWGSYEIWYYYFFFYLKIGSYLPNLLFLLYSLWISDKFNLLTKEIIKEKILVSFTFSVNFVIGLSMILSIQMTEILSILVAELFLSPYYSLLGHTSSCLFLSS